MSTPWDTNTFGIPTFELLEYSAEILEQSSQTCGHYSIKVDPLADKRLLRDYGFYYCDTLIEPFCTTNRLRAQLHAGATIEKNFDRDRLVEICDGSFSNGRFHRDFNISKTFSNVRYNRWLLQLIDEEKVYGLYWHNELAGFIGFSGNSLVLHAISDTYRGKGLSKYWWSEVSLRLLADGHETIVSSISTANLAVLNLYASLGFSFRSPKDIYHRLVP